MSQHKYVCIDTGLNDVIIIFSDVVQHEFMEHLPGKIVSAGFINLNTFKCYGKSVSLNTSSRPEDTQLAIRQFGDR